MACLQVGISSIRKKTNNLEVPQTQEYSECGNIQIIDDVKAASFILFIQVRS